MTSTLKGKRMLSEDGGERRRRGGAERFSSVVEWRVHGGGWMCLKTVSGQVSRSSPAQQVGREPKCVPLNSKRRRVGSGFHACRRVCSDGCTDESVEPQKSQRHKCPTVHSRCTHNSQLHRNQEKEPALGIIIHWWLDLIQASAGKEVAFIHYYTARYIYKLCPILQPYTRTAKEEDHGQTLTPWRHVILRLHL